MQLPFAKLSQGLVLYLEGSIDRPLLLLRGDAPRLRVSRPLEESRPLDESRSLLPAGEAEREELDPLRFPLPLLSLLELLELDLTPGLALRRFPRLLRLRPLSLSPFVGVGVSPFAGAV